MSSFNLPRIAITYCTQCHWMLRAAYFAQELLSTFASTIGEIALIPRSGGIFNISLTYVPLPSSTDTTDDDSSLPKTVMLWDRKTDGGFPEAKVLKQRLRNHIDPGRNLGHSDATTSKTVLQHASSAQLTTNQKVITETNEKGPIQDKSICEDCT